MPFALWTGTEGWTDCWSCFYMEEINNSGVVAATTSQITSLFIMVNIFFTRAAANTTNHCTFHPRECRGAKDNMGHSCPSHHFSAAYANHCPRACSNCPLAAYPSRSLPAAHSPNQKLSYSSSCRCWQDCFSDFPIRGWSSGPAYPRMIS